MRFSQVALCDLEQNVLHQLDDRVPGAKVGISRHGARSFSVSLGLNHPALEDAAIQGSVLRAKVEGWDDPIFVGRIVSKDANLSGEQQLVTLNALDPWAHLEKCAVLITDTGWTPDVERFAAYVAQHPSDIMASLINGCAANGHGIVEGLTPNSTVWTQTFPAGSGVAEGVLAMSALEGIGPDFEITPTEATDGTLATFNAFHPRQGSDKTATVVVGIGLGEDGEALAIQRKPSGDQVINQFTAIGDASGAAATDGTTNYASHPAYIARHEDSITDRGGVFEASESLSGNTDAATLERHAKSMVAANAYPTEGFVLLLDPTDAGPEFSPDGDFWMGDTIGAAVHEPWMVDEDGNLYTETLEGRVGGAGLTEQENGLLLTEVSCEPEPFSGVTGATAVVVPNNGEGTVVPTWVYSHTETRYTWTWPQTPASISYPVYVNPATGATTSNPAVYGPYA